MGNHINEVRATSSRVLQQIIFGPSACPALPVECSTVRGRCISSSSTISITKTLVTEETTALLHLVRAFGWASGVRGGVWRVVLVEDRYGVVY